MAMTLSNLGTVLRDLRELGAARQVYGRALLLYKRLAAREPHLYGQLLALLLQNLAGLHERLGEQSQADHYYRRAARWARRSPGLLRGADVLDKVGARFLRRARTEAHRWYGERILDLALARGERAIAGLSRGEDSQLDLHKRRLENAYGHGVYQYAVRNGAGTERLCNLLESLRQVERRSLEAGLDAEADRPAPLETAAGRAEPQADCATLDAALANEHRRLAERRKKELDALREHKAALLYIQPTPRGVVLHLLPPDGPSATAIAPVRFGRLMDALFLLILRLHRFGGRGARTVYHRTVKPTSLFKQRVNGLAVEAAEILRGACPQVLGWFNDHGPRLWLSPHGPANRWPIEFLPDGANFLGLQWPLPRVAGLRDLVEILGRRPQPGHSLVVGNPTANLEHAETFSQKLHQHLGQVTSAQAPNKQGRHALLVRNQARQERMLPLLADPELSFFLFNGHGGRARSGAVALLAGEETLSCTDLTALRWPKQPWVHLDCCHGGYERYSGGGRLDGLTYAALTAGASAVLASHHSVGDEDTAAFADVFYDRWLRQEDTAAEALLAARHKLFESARHDVLLWALPVLHGNARVRSPWASAKDTVS
jgi:hypothetical protein